MPAVASILKGTEEEVTLKHCNAYVDMSSSYNRLTVLNSTNASEQIEHEALC